MKVFGLFGSRRKSAEGDAAVAVADHDAADATAPNEAAAPESDTVPAEEEPVEALPEPAAPTEEFDREFERAFESAAPTADEGGSSQDAASNRELFVGIAVRQAKPVKHFVRQLQRGSTAKDLIAMCRPVLSSTLEAAEGVDLREVAQCLTDLDEALSMAQAEEGTHVDGEARDLILSCYEELETRLPEAFSLDDDADSHRDTLIVHSLLRQIPDVGHVTLEKLYSAGFTSIEVLIQASREDLAVTTGIRPTLAESICDHVQRHHEAMWGLQAEQLPAMLRDRLTGENDTLRKLHESFEATAAAEVTKPKLGARKRELRRDRQTCAWRIELTLAELDELELLEHVQREPYGKRVETIDCFLSKPTAVAAPTPQGG